MVSIDTYGTNKISEDKINIYAKNLIDLSVKGIIDKLNLRQPIYSETSSYGHFGNESLPWEQIEKN